MVFCDWLPPRKRIFKVHLCGSNTLFPFMVEYYSVCMAIYHILSIHSAAGHLGRFYFLATMNNAAMKVRLRVFVWTSIFLSLEYIAWSGVAGSYIMHFIHAGRDKNKTELVPQLRGTLRVPHGSSSKAKARPSTSKKITSGFMAVVWNQTHNMSELPVVPLCSSL